MSDIHRVKGAADIVRIIGEVVALKAKGREYVGLCPFHNDRSPSMYVIPAKQMYHCFACRAGGDVLSFVRRFHKMQFREALEYVAGRAGVTLTPQRASSGDATPVGPSRSELLAAVSTAQGFFREHRERAREILAKRRISDATANQFGIGVAPDRPDALLCYLRDKGMDPRAFVEAKLIRRRDDGSLCDAFRNRLMFPIHDRLGRVIAFGGRRINDEDEPKYVNSTESRLFDKSATLYALPLASRAIQESRTAIVVEGYTDVIACHQAGFGNAVATLGTALTPKHVSVLHGLCKRVLLVFDSDEAGQLAADRATASLVPSSLEVAVVMLRDAKDPDEVLGRECGPAAFAGALASAMSLREYRVNRVRARVLGGTPKSVALEEEIHAILGGLREASPARQRLVVQRLREIV